MSWSGRSPDSIHAAIWRSGFEVEAERGAISADDYLKEFGERIGYPLSAKVAVVAGGYIVAFLVAAAAVAIRVANTSGPEAQAAGGMYAFGDVLLFVAMFGVAALVPTGAALFFLRPYRPFWTVLSALGLAVAVTGVTAAILFAVGRDATPSALATWAGFSVLRILVAPLLALTFLVCTIFSPHRTARLACLAATVMEAAVSAYGGFVWFVPLFLQRP